MRTQGFFSQKINVSLLAGLLLLLSGCDWFGKKEQKAVVKKQIANQIPLTGDVLISWQENKTEGVPLVTSSSLQVEKEKLLKTNPQLKMMIEAMDERQLDRSLSEGLMNQAIVDRYIEEKEIDKKQDYQAELQEGYKAVERMINTKFFSQALPIQVTDAEVKDFYEKNKNVVPDLLISRGGTEAMGMMFDDEKMANDFLRETKEQKNLQKAAQKMGLTDKVKDFKVVNEQSIGIEAPLREKIVNMKTTPGTELLKVDDKFWVVYTSKKNEPKYRPLGQVKDNIKQFLEKEKRSEKFDEEMTKLKKEYKVVVNEAYFKSEEPAEVTANQQKESRMTGQPMQKRVAENKTKTTNESKQKKQLAANGTQVI